MLTFMLFMLDMTQKHFFAHLGTKKTFFRKMSNSAKKCKRRNPVRFIHIHSVAKYQKTRREDPFESSNNIAQRRKKSKSFSLDQFCRLRLKSKKERGPFALRLHRPDLA